MQKIPVLAVVGDKEVESGCVAPRWRGDGQTKRDPIAVGAFVEEVAAAAAMPGAASPENA